MIGWNRITNKEANEVMKARKNAIAVADVESRFCEGNIQLEIKPFESFCQINKCTRYLAAIENVRIVSESWSEDAGFNIILSVQEPVALGQILKDMPDVDCVRLNGNKKGLQKMVVVLKSIELTPVLVPA